jgi:hypothetical protein
MAPRLVLVTAAVAAVLTANWLAWRGVLTKPLPATAATASAAGLTWDGFAAITGNAEGVVFPAALIAREGAVVEMVGVLYPLPQLVEQGHLLGAVLAPPAKFACCGLSCEARSLSLVFITPKDALPDPGRRRLARVTGILRLHREAGHWSPTELEQASVELLPDP